MSRRTDRRIAIHHQEDEMTVLTGILDHRAGSPCPETVTICRNAQSPGYCDLHNLLQRQAKIFCIAVQNRAPQKWPKTGGILAWFFKPLSFCFLYVNWVKLRIRLQNWGEKVHHFQCENWDARIAVFKLWDFQRNLDLL